MRLGVDFGTTRTIVAAVDRGNYPVVAFEDDQGGMHDHVPSVVARHQGRLVFGHEALATARDHGAPYARSFKRLLSSPELTAETTMALGDGRVPLLEVLTGFLRDLREQVEKRSTIAGELDGVLQAAVAVPAHASGAQRLLTLHAFRAAGFDVVALLNEPSAAGFEFSHRHRRAVTSRRTRVVVYDLGGGTFDASLVDVRGTHHDVEATAGADDLGGDDFDAVLAGLAASRTDAHPGPPSAELLEESRQAKERISPQSRRVVVEVGEEPVVIPVADFYDAAGPLVERSLDTMAPLLDRIGDGAGDLAEVAGVYLVGGASALPLVSRRLRERFGRRVHASPFPAGSTAIGLAIAADEESGFSLTDRLSRSFGVFREGREGTAVSFDQLLGREQRLADTDVEVVRRYRAAHNVGWFRFVEYADLDGRGEPQGALVPFADVVFPFDPALQDGRDLRDVAVVHAGSGPLVEERYVIDPHGIIELQITDLDTGYRQTHTLG
ncbi:Hsp70 family protein [Nocardioides ferulae]|uniref:Hsp70 family protein n=1 Tax=Nocardioides ferulae TaxID=2340821 RepID=UPI000EB4B329|nr:Hsp70 family protein [Nocardioides ferulae]